MPIDITKLTLEEILDLKNQLSAVKLINPGSKGQRITRYDMSTWDWAKSNAELITEHGAHSTTVSQGRAIYGNGKVTKWYPACKEWDWTKSNAEISRATGAIVGVVQNYRKKLGHPPGPRERQPSTYQPTRIRPDYSTLDWTKRDIELAREVGVSREYIRQIRIKLGHPKIIHSKGYDAFLHFFSGCTEVSAAEVKERMGREISSYTLDCYCQRAGIKRVVSPRTYKNPIHPWDQFNWQIPNLMLAEIWGMSRCFIANYRARHEFDFPAFRYIKGNYPPEHEAVVTAEKLKAGSYKLKEHYDDPASELIP